MGTSDAADKWASNSNMWQSCAGKEKYPGQNKMPKVSHGGYQAIPQNQQSEDNL